MDKQVLTVGLPTDVERKLSEGLSIVKLSQLACEDVEEAHNLISAIQFCLIILNAMDWDADGTRDVVRMLRKLTITPIMVLCPREFAPSVLEVGADVCMPLSVDAQLFFSQATALIRRNYIYNSGNDNQDENRILRCGDLELDLRNYVARCRGEEVFLRRLEYRALVCLVRNAGSVVTKEQIINAVWRGESTGDHNIAVMIAILRNKLQDDYAKPRYIETIHGVGYRFIIPQE